MNYRLHPDLVVCLHFNAEPWGDPKKPTLVENNHLHLLVNGAYLPNELELDDERFEMLQKLLSRAFPEELGLAESIATTMAKETGLPAYHYKTENVTPVGTSGYVFARNLMATRLYRCPTVYLEPYVMNSHEVFDRIKREITKGTTTSRGKSDRAFTASMWTAWSRVWWRISRKRGQRNVWPIEGADDEDHDPVGLTCEGKPSYSAVDRRAQIFHRHVTRNAGPTDGVRDHETDSAVLEFLVAGQRFEDSRARKIWRQFRRQMMRLQSRADLRGFA